LRARELGMCVSLNLLEAPKEPEITTITGYLKSAKKMGIKYLYGGNIMSDEWSDTYCPECKGLLIKRSGYATRIVNLSEGICQQ